jgi:regulator of protease activity HflC (stomatin/prohibitin superfamily)
VAVLTVMEHQRAVQFRRGRLDGVLEPGRYRYRRSRVSHDVVDMRPRIVTVHSQEILTSDGVTVRASLLARWRAIEPVTFVTATVSAEAELYALLQIAARRTVGERTAEQVLGERPALAGAIGEAMAALEPARLGIDVDLVDVKDVMFPGEFRRAFAQVAVAREQARASLERARGEVAAMRALANAARTAHGNPELMHLRTLQAVGETNGTVVLAPAWPSAAAVPGGVVNASPAVPSTGATGPPTGPDPGS